MSRPIAADGTINISTPCAEAAGVPGSDGVAPAPHSVTASAAARVIRTRIIRISARIRPTSFVVDIAR